MSSDLEERLAQVEAEQQLAALGGCLRGCGCLLTLFVTLPILLLG